MIKPGKNSIYILSGIAAITLLIAAFFYYFWNNQNPIYIEIKNVSIDMSGNRILIDNVRVGELSLEKAVASNIYLYRLKFDQEVNIPSRSTFLLSTDKQSNLALFISLVASNDYFSGGDTIRTLFIDPGLPSGIWTKKAVLEKSDQIKQEIEVDKPGILFRVQLMASKTRISLDSPKFKGIDGVEEILENELYKYYVAESPSYDVTKEIRKLVVEKGFKDAFIVAYKENQRIPIKDALDNQK